MKEVIKLKESDIHQMVHKVIREQEDVEPVEKTIDSKNMVKDIRSAYFAGCNKVGSSKCNPTSEKAWLDIVYRNNENGGGFNEGIRYYSDKKNVDMTPSIELIEAIVKYI